MKRLVALWLAATSLMGTGCAHVSQEMAANEALVGAWKSQVQFKSGAFASIQDLEFMYVFNAGGTLTESSNYDGVPPVPPAYGIWRRIGPNRFEARYEFYATKPPARLEELTTGGGWQPAGRGVFIERIEMAPDSQSYTSTIRYSAFDAKGVPVEGGGEANGRAMRSGF
ncbi:MAG TPA: hypothetical protein VJ484_03020 [Lysobacter sp.]|nr:hypothetical protein [Lysobacter sp.]